MYINNRLCDYMLTCTCRYQCCHHVAHVPSLVFQSASYCVGNAAYHSAELYQRLAPAIPLLIKLLGDQVPKTRANAASKLKCCFRELTKGGQVVISASYVHKHVVYTDVGYIVLYSLTYRCYWQSVYSFRRIVQQFIKIKSCCQVRPQSTRSCHVGPRCSSMIVHSLICPP